MKSNNPVFSRSEEFNRSGANTYGNQTYAGGYGSDPSTWGTGTPGDTGYGAPQAPAAPMTIDSVVQKTSITLGVVLVTAFGTWILTPDLRDNTQAGGALYAALMIGSLGAFALSMVNSFKKVISPGLVLAFAALEGVAMGAFSKFIEQTFVPQLF